MTEVRLSRTRLGRRLTAFRSAVGGAVALEYSLILAMIVVALIGMSSLSTAVKTTLYDDLATTMNENTN